MCGITGFWTTNRDHIRRREDIVRALAAYLTHRGPDAAGTWTGEPSEPVLGHRRLAILDLSEAGRQPMISSDGRWVLTYNGEVYNYRDLRSRLRAGAGAEFRGESDTEVLVEAIARWGLRETLERADGMFAFAAWDRREERLSLVRDRLGIKPLFYGHTGEGIVFGSEIDAVAGHPGMDAEISPTGIGLLLKYKRIPAPWSIYKDVRKLRPGTIVTLEAPGSAPAESTWWSAREAMCRGREQPFRGTPEEAVDALEAKLAESVEARMVSDVPLGAFLSGGIDSSTVAAMMQAVSDRTVRTYTMGVADETYDESSDAARVADYLGTDHTEREVRPAEARAVIPKLPEMFDEPFADPTQIPNYLVSKIASREVTVALSGDGGDELYGGYNRHLWGPRVWAAVRAVPALVRRGASAAGRALSEARWNALGGTADRVVPGGIEVRRPGQKVHKLADALPARDPAELYERLDTQWFAPTELVRGLRHCPSPVRRAFDEADGAFAERMMYADLVGYLPDQILTKVDRTTMAVSLEGRVPMLDHRLVEFAWRLPAELKIRDGTGKWVLRQVLYRHVPKSIVDRPKTGFGFPVGDWLRGPLREWADELLDERRLREQGYLRAAPIRQAWERHREARSDVAHQLWAVLMFQAWLERKAS